MVIILDKEEGREGGGKRGWSVDTKLYLDRRNKFCCSIDLAVKGCV